METIGKGDINTFNRRTRSIHHFVINDKILIVIWMRRRKPLARPFQTRGGRTAFLNTDQLGKIIFGQRFYPERRAVLRKIPRTNAVGKRHIAVVATKTEVPDHNSPIRPGRYRGNAVGFGPPVGQAVCNCRSRDIGRIATTISANRHRPAAVFYNAYIGFGHLRHIVGATYQV